MRGNMDRRMKALQGIDVKTKIGLEFGPLASPLVRRSDGAVLYADHATTEELRAKYQNHDWDTGAIVDVDLVLSQQSIQEQLGDRRVDYIVASHVIEHVPDMIGWLNSLSEVLTPNGVISLVIPDKRFCFDARRPLSTTGELLEACIEKRQAPTTRQIFDFWSLYCGVDSQAIWGGKISTESIPFSGTLENAFDHVKAARTSSAYSDIHCWVFTPASFLINLANLSELGLVSLKIKSAIDTVENDLEFFIKLEKVTSHDTPADIVGNYRYWANMMSNCPRAAI